MTSEEIELLSKAMIDFFRGPGQGFLITNASMEALVQEFAWRLRRLKTHDRALALMAENAPRVGQLAVANAQRREIFADFGGRPWPVLTEDSAHDVSKVCPDDHPGW